MSYNLGNYSRRRRGVVRLGEHVAGRSEPDRRVAARPWRFRCTSALSLVPCLHNGCAACAPCFLLYLLSLIPSPEFLLYTRIGRALTSLLCCACASRVALCTKLLIHTNSSAWPACAHTIRRYEKSRALRVRSLTWKSNKHYKEGREEKGQNAGLRATGPAVPAARKRGKLRGAANSSACPAVRRR